MKNLKNTENTVKTQCFVRVASLKKNTRRCNKYVYFLSIFHWKSTKERPKKWERTAHAQKSRKNGSGNDFHRQKNAFFSFLGPSRVPKWASKWTPWLKIRTQLARRGSRGAPGANLYRFLGVLPPFWGHFGAPGGHFGSLLGQFFARKVAKVRVFFFSFFFSKKISFQAQCVAF